jgi:flagellar assembly protein FliH
VRPLLLTTPVDAGRQQETRDLVITDLGVERAAAIEREARDRGFAAGEREGREVARVRADALAARMAQTIDAIAALRTGMLHRSEQDVVRLAIAIAERIIHREVQLDREVILVAARAAIARLGAAAVVTVRVNPDDLAAMAPRLDVQGTTGPIRLEADAAVPPGGCVVASNLGDVDATIEAQIQELRAALLADDERRAGDTLE